MKWAWWAFYCTIHSRLSGRWAGPNQVQFLAYHNHSCQDCKIITDFWIKGDSHD